MEIKPICPFFNGVAPHTIHCSCGKKQCVTAFSSTEKRTEYALEYCANHARRCNVFGIFEEALGVTVHVQERQLPPDEITEINDFIDHIGIVMEQRDMTQTDVANKCGIAQSSVSLFFSKQRCSENAIRKICNAIGVEIPAAIEEKLKKEKNHEDQESFA